MSDSDVALIFFEIVIEKLVDELNKALDCCKTQALNVENYNHLKCALFKFIYSERTSKCSSEKHYLQELHF